MIIKNVFLLMLLVYCFTGCKVNDNINVIDHLKSYQLEFSKSICADHIAEIEKIINIDDFTCFDLHKSTFVKSMLEDYIEKIMLNSTIGNKLFVDNETDSLYLGHRMGISPLKAIELDTKFRKKFDYPLNFHIHQNQIKILELKRNNSENLSDFLEKSLKVIEDRTKIPRKKFLLVKVNQMNIAFDSWTNQHNTTFLFINPSTTLHEIKSAITHEIYLAYDSKKYFKSKFNQSFHLNGTIQEELTRETKDKTDQINELDTYLQFPLIRYAFTMMRAFVFEMDVWHALYPDDEKFGDEDLYNEVFLPLKNNNCAVAVANVLHLLRPIEESLMDENGPSLDEVNLIKFKEFILNNQLRYNLIQHSFVNKHFTTVSYSNITTCNALSIPIMGQFYFEITKGPRPRVKGGWKVNPLWNDPLLLEKKYPLIDNKKLRLTPNHHDKFPIIIKHNK